MSTLLDTRSLTVSRGGRTLVGQLDLQLAAGDRLAILGRNGAGKSTLLHTLAGLRAADAGTVRLAGKTYGEWHPREAARLRGLLPQQAVDAFGATVMETALIGRHPHLSRWQNESAEDERIAREALASVGLQSMSERRADTLSGGERQRLSIATLLTQAPQLLLLDEPLAHLDLGAQIPLLELITCKPDRAVAMVMHDPTLAWRFCTRALLLFDEGKWLLGEAGEVINTDTLSRLHGHRFRQFQDGEHRLFFPA